MALTVAQASKARLALQRFGMGPRPGTIARIAADPKAAVLAEIADPGKLSIGNATLPTYKAAAADSQRGFSKAHAIYEDELRARYRKAITAEIGFGERLVHFWSNHFSMSVDKGETVRGTVGQFERDVIRKHALGSFADMLVGVMQHPAMISYLDNEDSIGPRSPIGRSWGVGLNENLAREILELHTVGVGGGYDEDDILSLAKAITGWSYVRGWEADHRWSGGSPANRGQFIYRADWHEPGSFTVMGNSYRAGGLAQGEAVLRDLAVHPRTAEHLAFKMVRHFLADVPSPTLVRRLAKAYLDADGNLGAMARAMVGSDAAWSMPLAKLRTPAELAIAQFRALEIETWPANMNWAVTEPLRALANMPHHHGQPDGYPDENGAWLEPNAMRIRLETAMLFTWHFARNETLVPADLARLLFDSALEPSTRAAIDNAPDWFRGMVVLLMSPEFQRR